MSKIIDLTGKKFNRLTAIKVVGQKRGNNAWLCRCDCGKETVVTQYSLVSGSTKSCGCWKLEEISERQTTHGKSKTRLYNTYKGMKARCYNPNTNRYAQYGGRGIEVCEEWRNDFQAFYDWAMGNGYNPEAKRGECTIDRIDSNGNYEPSNCRWVSIAKQERNKRNHHIIEFEGETHTVTEWSEKTGIGVSTIIFRLKNGWSTERALSVPPLIKKSKQKTELAI